MKTIPNSDQIQWVQFAPNIKAFCSIGLKPFTGRVIITYEPQDFILEFVSVEEFIHELENQSMTIEGMTRILFDELVRVLGDIPLQVQVLARTTVHAPASALIKQGEFKNVEKDNLGYRDPDRSLHWFSSGR